MTTIYIALPITGRGYNDVVLEIFNRKSRLEGIGYKVIHPMTGKSYLRTEKEFKPGGYTTPTSTNHAIYERDQWMVRQCDIILLDFTNCKTCPTGMTMELAWASLLGKHSILIMPADSPYRHAFILELLCPTAMT